VVSFGVVTQVSGTVVVTVVPSGRVVVSFVVPGTVEVVSTGSHTSVVGGISWIVVVGVGSSEVVDSVDVII